MTWIFLYLIWYQINKSFAYGDCPGGSLTYSTNGELEQWSCEGSCIPVDQHCNGKCYSGSDNWGDQSFSIWENRTCVRNKYWFHCDSDVAKGWGNSCIPGTQGCKPLQESCGGECFIDTALSSSTTVADWWKCKHQDQCVLATLVCSGLGPFCRDGSDQAKQTCSNEEAINTECKGVTKYGTASRDVRCSGDRPMQCVKDQRGKDCLDKSDQDQQVAVFGTTQDISEEIKNKTINLISKLKVEKQCDSTAPIGWPGLRCEEVVRRGEKQENTCIANVFWCTPSTSDPRNCTLSTSPILKINIQEHDMCFNRTFWEDIPCVAPDDTTTPFSAQWSRCSGTTPGQCFRNHNQCTVKDGWGTCTDRSHRVCNVSHTYKASDGGQVLGKTLCAVEDMWMCADQSTCLDENLLCDGHAQCPDKSDESLFVCSCPWNLTDSMGPEILKNKGVSSANIRCLDAQYPDSNLITCAVRCDGRIECQDGRDERGCQENKEIFWTTAGCVVVIFIAASIILVHIVGPFIQNRITSEKSCDQQAVVELSHQKSGSPTLLRSMSAPDNPPDMTRSPSIYIAHERLIQIISKPEIGLTEDKKKREMMDIMGNLHNSINFSHSIQIIATTLQIDPSKQEIERRNQVLYDLEVEVHGGNGHLVCIKNNMQTNTVTAAVLKGSTPGIKDKIITFMETKICSCITLEGVFRMENWFKSSRITRLITSFAEIGFYYVDLLKDLAVVFIMLRLLTDPRNTDITFGAFIITFNGQFLVIMIFSIIAGTIITAAYLSIDHPGEELQIIGIKRKSLLRMVRVLTFVLSLLVPTTLIYQLTRQKIKLKDMEEYVANTIMITGDAVDQKDVERIIEQREKVNTLSTIAYVRQKNDLAFEVTIQVTVTVGMILIVAAFAESLTETGLQAVFIDDTTLLVFSFLMSFKKIVTSNLALVSAEKKGFISIIGKCLRAISFLFASILRIGVITLYFGLPLGVLNILIHTTSYDKYNKESKSMVYDTQFVDGHLSVLRINETYTVTHYTDLTGMRLRWFGIFAFIGVIIHIIVVTVVKKFVFSERFSVLPHMDKFLHIVHTVAFPEASVDWDYGNTGTLETYKRQWDQFRRELIFMLTLHTVQNFLMTIPLIYICTNVINYHLTLPYTTDLENEAYYTARLLRTFCPIIVWISPFVQWLLMLAYNKYGHPWNILYVKFGEIDGNTEQAVVAGTRNKGFVDEDKK